MIRNMITAVALVTLVAICGCQEQQGNVSITTLTAPDADFVGRVGYGTDGAEAFFAYKCFGGEPEEPDALGGGVIIYLTQELGITDTPPPSGIAQFLESLSARPYIGTEFAIPLHGSQRRASANFIVGTEFKNDPDSAFSLVLEGMAGDGAVTARDDYGLFLGARIRFK